MMTFEREIGRLLRLLLAGLVVIMGSAAYWSVAGADSLLLREDNPRRVEFERAIVRGTIYDAAGVVLAESITGEGRFPRRIFRQPATFGTIGYFSMRYGTDGVEAFFNTILSGAAQPATLESWWHERVLGVPRTGSDLRLTLDLALQQAASTALGRRRGAAVVLEAQTGRLLALVSRPAYDPNDLDAQWEMLRQSPDDPFFNRALRGRYQPGGALQLPMLLLASLAGVDTRLLLEDANAPVALDEITLRCALAPPRSRLSLADALSYGCPAATRRLVEVMDDDAIWSALALFNLGHPPAIAGVSAAPAATAIPTPTAVSTPTPDVLADALGQGSVVLNPLAYARLMAAVATNGSAPPLVMADAVRPPNAESWQPLAAAARSESLVVPSAAAAGRAWLLATGAMLGLPPRAGGHVALAHSGAQTNALFAGFAQSDGMTAVVVVIVEESACVKEALAVGQAVIKRYLDTSSMP